MSNYLENGPSWPPGTPPGPLPPGMAPHPPNPQQMHPDGMGHNPYPSPAVVYVGQAPPAYGLSTGMHVFHGVMTAATCLLWTPVWILHAMAARRRPIA